jgi:hypothetical protein
MDTATARCVCEGLADPYTYALYPTELSKDAKLYRPSTAPGHLTAQDPTDRSIVLM